MNQAPRVRLSHDQLAVLLRGEVVEGVRHDGTLPKRGEGYPVTLVETFARGYRVERLDVSVIVASSKLRPGCKRSWTLALLIDRAGSPMTLAPQSTAMGGSISPLAESHNKREPIAHGYVEGSDPLEAGEAIPHKDVMATGESQEAAERFASEKVDAFARRRIQTVVKRTEGVLMQGRANGVDLAAHIEAVNELLNGVVEATKQAA